jgi:hypothetical protein
MEQIYNGFLILTNSGCHFSVILVGRFLLAAFTTATPYLIKE